MSEEWFAIEKAAAKEVLIEGLQPLCERIQELERQLARSQAQFKVAQDALVKIDRGGRPMRDIAAQALLDIAMVPYGEATG